MNRLQRALIRLQVDLRQLGLRWALVGGLAVSLRSEPRTTRDLDVTLAIADDREAEGVVRSFTARGYRFQWAGEHQERDRLLMTRLRPSPEEIRGVDIDLMFASSGIEQEIVEAAEMLEIFPMVNGPVATTAHLLALKTLAGRAKDVTDFATLIKVASERDIQMARKALDLMTRRGYDRGKDLQAEFSTLLERAPGEI